MKGEQFMIEDHVLQRLITAYGDDILRMCFLYLKDYQLAEDATQETFLKAMNTYQDFRHLSSEKTWLIRIAINNCKNIMRTRWFRSVQHLSEDDIQARGGTDAIDAIVDKASVSGAIMSLKKNDRQVIALFYYQELSVKEIAKIIKKSENATLQCLKRARDRLEIKLKEVGYAD